MAKLVRRHTSNVEILSSNLSGGTRCIFLIFLTRGSKIIPLSDMSLSVYNRRTSRSDTIKISPHNTIRIGRVQAPEICATECVVDDPQVSSTHCFIWSACFDESTPPLTYIQDISLNGTLINGRKLRKGFTILSDRDLIEIGDHLSLRYTGESFKEEVVLEENGWKVISQVIGKGTFGQVLNCATASKENQILTQIEHPNIVRVHECLETNGSLRIYEDLATGGDLFSYMAQGNDVLRPVSESQALLIVYQVLKALEYLHSRGIVHRDLKLDNILIKRAPVRYPYVVLADFGAARRLDAQRTKRSAKRMFTMVGTPEYAAPEINLMQPRSTRGYTNKVDIWSLGVITYILLTGVSPFYSPCIDKTIVKVRQGDLLLKIEEWSKISIEAKQFVKGCLRAKVLQRLDVSGCLETDWINKRSHLYWLEKCYRAILGQ
ncbi:hypothetical protein KL934_001937 [Ogataea polymorpha]|nr:hypothetical protein KL934_001937 [Ogataea polymorpha]